MSRSRRCRKVLCTPNITYFKPAGIPMVDLEEITLNVDEFEAVRLKDLEGFDQEKCAEMMNISQPTFHRLLLSSRKKIAYSMVHGKRIKIEGGNFEIAPRIKRNRMHNRRWRGNKK